MTNRTDRSSVLIDRWFPVAAVDESCGTPAGSGQNEKALFTWFASRPIAQARAAVLCSLLPDPGDDDTELQELVNAAVLTGDDSVLAKLADRIPTVDGKPPVVLDCFSGRGIIPLEAARIGMRAVGTDSSPVAVLASRLLADYALRDWSTEPDGFFSKLDKDASESLFDDDIEPKLVQDVRSFLNSVGERMRKEVAGIYPVGPDGRQPWGYLWATTVPCDSCRRRFPLIGTLALRHPYRLTSDPGQSLEIDVKDDTWSVRVHDGLPEGRPTLRAPEGRRGKSAWCPFCGHQHPLDAIKAKGFAGQYGESPLVAGDLEDVTVPMSKGRTRKVERKTFRILTEVETTAAVDPELPELSGFNGLSRIPDEEINVGNNNEVQGSAYGVRLWSDLMNKRQALLFAATVKAIRETYDEVIAGGASKEYGAALCGFASANLVRRLRRATKGARLQANGRPDGSQQNRNRTGDVFASESIIQFNFDWFETGPGSGPGTWESLTATFLRPLAAHVGNASPLAAPGTFRQASARSMPYRDDTVDAAVCDPPYYSMIAYSDVSDLFYVWLRRCLSDIIPDLFGEPGDAKGLQDKSEEIIVKRGGASVGDHRTVDWYENEMGTAFGEMRRILKPGGTLSVVFGHSDPEAWRRLLGALRSAGFVVTSAWPARTESANTGVASIKVTVTIGCRVAPSGRTSSTAAQVEREVVELVRKRVPKWDEWGLALSDQLMASYGPAMQVVGRYKAIQRPDGTEPELDHFLAIGRRAVVDAHAFKVDELPLDTFDPHTRFAIFWLRAFKRTVVNKGEAVFHAQSSQMRIDELRPDILEDAPGGYRITLASPAAISERSSTIGVARALAVAWPSGGTDAAANVLAASGREADDAHLWATVGELVRQLPDSDKIAMALTACQRNRRPIEGAARHAIAASDTGEQLTIDTPGES